jgi:4-diphosphocytidyl-2-C-methyl-D-erythritol kinase
VPRDESNTCWRVADRVLKTLRVKRKIRISIEKRLPVQGGLGGASSNAVATLLGLEKGLKRRLSSRERLRIAAEVGSDLPLFLIGGTVLGSGRGEEVYPLQDLPSFACVVAAPGIGVSTPAAFDLWDRRQSTSSKLTCPADSDRIKLFSRSLCDWLIGTRNTPTGVSAKSWDRAEALLLDLVRTGIENDFETVVFPQHPAIRRVKSVLESYGTDYASLSGSGATVYGLFQTRQAASRAAAKLRLGGIEAKATSTLTRNQYWGRIFPQ